LLRTWLAGLYRVKNFSVIGAGNLGNYLINSLVRKGYILKYIYKKSKSRHYENAITGDMNRLVSQADFIIISTQESKIRGIAEQVASSVDSKEKIFFHTSNALTSGQLDCLAKKGARVASLSPLQTFPEFKAIPHVDIFKGIYFLSEGDEEAISLARQIVKNLDANLLMVEKEEKVYFHIAGVASSNFLIALLKFAEDQLKKVQKSPHDIKILLPLIIQTLKNAEERGVQTSLTGPAQRKEKDIIKKHLKALKSDEADLYHALTKFISSSF